VKDTGDLEAIKKRGELRVLIYGDGEIMLPRAGSSTATDRELAAAFAESLGLQVVPVHVEQFKDLIPMLLDGSGDIIAARLAETEERKKQIAFSRPTAVVSEMLVVKAGDANAPKDVAALAGKSVTVRKSSSYKETLDKLGVTTVDAAENADTESLVQDVAAGKVAMTACDSDLFDHIKAYTPGVEANVVLMEGRQIGFGIRPTNPDLKAAADAFLVQRALTSHAQKFSTGDLAEMKKRGSIRMLTRNNAVSYFLYKGTQQGFDYELMKMFAKENGLRLDVIVPPEASDLIPWLLEGRGDVIAAQMSITDARKEKIAFSEPYVFVDEVLIQKAGEAPITDAAQLSGKSVHVRASSSYRETLTKVAGVNIVPAPEDKETEQLIGMVGRGEIPMTLADSTIAAVELAYRSDVQATLKLKTETPIGYGARKDSKELLAALDAFVKKNYRGLEYNVLKKQYFENKRVIDTAHTADARATGHISPYDDIIKKRSQEYGLDWRLMASQAYQESRFDPQAKSWVGAKGLFQVMPATGKEMGFNDLENPEEGTHAGVKYMSRLIAQFEPDLPFKQRVRFALAAYNAGKGHVDDARRLAKDMNLNPDKWFGNVEKAMLLLQDPKVAKKARHGYCRGEEPVKYVSEIQSRYDNYLTVVKDLGPTASK
jgi:membrane-bound lytic murein transglycosylase F